MPAVICPKCGAPLPVTAIPGASLARCVRCGLVEPAWGAEPEAAPQRHLDADARLRAAVRAYLARESDETRAALSLALVEAESAARVKA